MTKCDHGRACPRGCGAGLSSGPRTPRPVVAPSRRARKRSDHEHPRGTRRVARPAPRVDRPQADGEDRAEARARPYAAGRGTAHGPRGVRRPGRGLPRPGGWLAPVTLGRPSGPSPPWPTGRRRRAGTPLPPPERAQARGARGVGGPAPHACPRGAAGRGGAALGPSGAGGGRGRGPNRWPAELIGDVVDPDRGSGTAAGRRGDQSASTPKRVVGRHLDEHERQAVGIADDHLEEPQGRSAGSCSIGAPRAARRSRTAPRSRTWRNRRTAPTWARSMSPRPRGARHRGRRRPRARAPGPTRGRRPAPASPRRSGGSAGGRAGTGGRGSRAPPSRASLVGRPRGVGPRRPLDQAPGPSPRGIPGRGASALSSVPTARRLRASALVSEDDDPRPPTGFQDRRFDAFILQNDTFGAVLGTRGTGAVKASALLPRRRPDIHGGHG